MGDLMDKVHGDETVKFEEKTPKKLKEMLGHQPEEVMGGAILGIIDWYNRTSNDEKKVEICLKLK